MNKILVTNTEKKRSDQLIQHIANQIKAAGGAISFAQFMELALYTPQLGYYESLDASFGKDFITAPLIHPLFAKSLARQCSDILRTLSGGDIVEVGAGSGQLAKDLLIELAQLNSLPNHYFIYEKSENLRLQQQLFLKKECPQGFDRIQWLHELPPKNPINGIIIGNEVLDALPFHCFKIGKDEVIERCVAWEDEQFSWKMTAPTSMELERYIRLILAECPLKMSYESEANLLINPFIKTLAKTLQKGVILLFDYGYGRREYYHPDRSMGTLMCFYQHQSIEDPFKNVGLQDITAHVDFTTVIESAIGANLNLGGYTTQSGFLLSCGLLDLANPTELSGMEYYQQNQAIKKLTLPSQMGELIKVMALTQSFKNPLLGFSLVDRRRSL